MLATCRVVLVSFLVIFLIHLFLNYLLLQEDRYRSSRSGASLQMQLSTEGFNTQDNFPTHSASESPKITDKNLSMSLSTGGGDSNDSDMKDELMDLMKQEDVYQAPTSTISKVPEGGAAGIGDVQGFNNTNINYPVQSATLSDEKMEIDKFFEISKDLEKHTKKDAKYIVPEPYLSRSTKDPLVARDVHIPDNWIYQNESVMNGGIISTDLTANDPLKTFYEIL